MVYKYNNITVTIFSLRQTSRTLVDVDQESIVTSVDVDVGVVDR